MEVFKNPENLKKLKGFSDLILEFNLEKYNYNLRKKLDLFFSDTSKEVKRLNDKLNTTQKNKILRKPKKSKTTYPFFKIFLNSKALKKKLMYLINRL